MNSDCDRFVRESTGTDISMVSLAELSAIAYTAEAPAELLPARQQTAFSLGWHIILACFRVAFPTMIFVLLKKGVIKSP